MNAKRGLLIAVSGLLSGCLFAPQHPPHTVPVNLKQLTGRWYEIASIPTIRQQNARCTITDYRITEDYLSIIEMTQENNHTRTRHHKAWPVAGHGNDTLVMDYFWPQKSTRDVLYHDKNYQTALIGTPERDHLWLYSRERTISTTTYNKLVTIAQQQGYPVGRLTLTAQTCPPEVS